jgi:hypothetical protein
MNRESRARHEVSRDRLQDLKWPMSGISCAAYHRGLLIISGTFGTSYFYFDLNKFEELHHTPDRKDVHAIAISKDYYCISSGSGTYVYHREAMSAQKKISLHKTLVFGDTTDVFGDTADIIIRGDDIFTYTQDPDAQDPDTQDRDGAIRLWDLKSEGDHIKCHIILKLAYDTGEWKGGVLSSLDRWTVMVDEGPDCVKVLQAGCENLEEIWAWEELKSYHTAIEANLRAVFDMHCRYMVIGCYPKLDSQAPNLHIHSASTRKEIGQRIKLTHVPDDLGAFLDFTFDFQTIIYFFQHGIIRVLNKPHNDMVRRLNQIQAESGSSRSVLIHPGFYLGR